MKIEYTGDITDALKTIKHIMIDRNVRQKDVCNATGWSKTTVSNLLNGRTPNPGINVLLTLCYAVGCKLYLDIEPRTEQVQDGQQ